jgi:hypothetical protein
LAAIDIDKVIINLLVCCTLCISGKAMAETNEYEDLEEGTAIPNIADQQDIGVFVLSRVVDASTGKPVENVEVSSSTNKIYTDPNGEFLLKVDPNGYILLRKENYKETMIKVADLKGKIKLDLVPKYLPVFPDIYGSINYRNLGFSEKFNDLSSSGRFNDSFSIEANARLMNNILVGLNYENISGILNRAAISEKANLANNLVSLRGAYIFNLLKDTLDLAAGIKGYWNGISLSNQVFNDQADRDSDYLDFGNTRLGLGLDAELGGRPLRYTPLVFGVFATYYPLVSVSQPPGGQLPGNLNQFDFGVSGRFDFAGAFVQARYLNRNLFAGSFSSSLNGFTIGLGYGF